MATRPFQHHGPTMSIEGEPVGYVIQNGDYYVAEHPLSPMDTDIAALVEMLTADSDEQGKQIMRLHGNVAALQAMIDDCRDLVNDLSGEAQEDLAAIVGWPEPVL